jgi:GTP-binding protein
MRTDLASRAPKQAGRSAVEGRFVISAAAPEQFPRDRLPEVAFLGRSNVGKSSLINALVGRKGLAFTSATPGRTQTINFYRIDGAIYFVDLPGYGYARAPKRVSREWGQLVEAYLRDRQPLALSLLILDARRGWMEHDLELKRWLDFYNRRYCIIATKMDKLKTHSEQEHGLAAIRKEQVEPLPFSAATGRGMREIWQAISKTLHTR